MFEIGTQPVLVAPNRVFPDVARETAYYVTLFSSQRPFNWPCYAHSFASFTRVRPRPARPGAYQTDTFTISWLPKTLCVCFWASPGEGQNRTLPETFEWALNLQARISAWGPYRIDSQLYEKAQDRYCQLEKGKLEYVCLDNYYRPHRATNCIHALSDLGLSPHLLRTGFSCGESATRKIIRHYSPWILEPVRQRAWLTGLLGLERYPIVFREPSVV